MIERIYGSDCCLKVLILIPFVWSCCSECSVAECVLGIVQIALRSEDVYADGIVFFKCSVRSLGELVK